jgi:hypothetical protein
MLSNEVWNTFWYALSITLKGMIGIFIFMGIFYLIIKLLDIVFPQKIEREENK